MNRKILVGVLIALAVTNVVVTLVAAGFLNPSNSENKMALDVTVGLAAGVSTTVTRGGTHHHYVEVLSVSLGGCAVPSGTAC